MKKILSFAILSLLVPSFAFASFDRSLKFGMSGNDVYDLQDILSESGCLTHASTGYFGYVTLNAVQCWQTKNNLPSTGYFGILSRGVANRLISDATASSTEAEAQEVGQSTPTPTQTPAPVYTPIQTSQPAQATPVTPTNTQPPAGNNAPITLSISQPVCISTTTSRFSISPVDWSKVYLIVAHFDGIIHDSGTDQGFSHTSGGRSISKNTKIDSGAFDWDSDQYGTVNYTISAYRRAGGDDNFPQGMDYGESSKLASIAGQITFPNCNQ